MTSPALSKPAPAHTVLPDLSIYDTLPKLVALNAAEHGDEVALREKDFGIWRAFTWADVHARIRSFALGLTGLGIGPGEVVAMIGDNRPDWLMAEVAAHAAGAMSLGIYRDALDEEVAYLITYGTVRVVFAEDEEQVDKLLNLGDRIPTVQHIVYSDPRGMRKYDDPRLLPVTGLVAMGDALAARQPGLYDEMVGRGTGEDVAILCTTSGTTSNPKLAMLPAGRLLRHCASYLAVDPKGSHDEYVSVLPLSWIMEQVYAVGMGILSRMRINFVEEAETMMHDFREIGASFVLFAPRLWESIAADVRARVMDASPLKQKLFEYGMTLGLKALAEGRRSWLADQILFRALRDRLGFSRLTSAATGGAALGPDTFRFFQALGVPLRQIYGQTETMGAYTVHRGDDVDFDTVGVPFDPGIEVKVLDPDHNGVGEVVTRHPNMFAGYFRNEAATAGELRDGWMFTGDAGYINPKGHLVIIDRIKDIATTNRGDRFSPQYIENKLKFSPYVAEAVILGDGHDYLAAMICIRFSIVSKWAEKNRIAFTTYADLSSRAQVCELLRTEVEKVNATLPEAQRISRFLLLYKELDADDGELTRTRKVRRSVINEKYKDIIDAIYTGRSSIDVDTTIAFQDGTRQRICTTLAVVDLAVGGRAISPESVAA
jgi:long-chain acyl-CoA synthetase